MSKIKVMREQEIVEIEFEDMQKGDVFALCNGKVCTCTDEPVYNDEDDCYYVQSGVDLYHELLVTDMEEIQKKLQFYISYERNTVGQGIIVEASDEKLAKEYFMNIHPDANVWGVREATYSEVHKPSMPIWTVPKEFEEAYYAKLNSNTEYPVYLVSDGGTKREFTVCNTEKEAQDLCESNDWQFKDENDFVWGMEYDEREKEKLSLDARMAGASERVSKSETSKDIAKETELQRD